MSAAPRPQILLTNDDGIQSPGLWAAAQALSALGYVYVTAPRDQVSGSGRSVPPTSDGRILSQRLQIGGQEWPVYAVGGTPAQVVMHGVMEIMPQPPDLVVSGINYGENPGLSVTVSGTVGAALEAASMGIPALAVSLELEDISTYLEHRDDVDFSTAAHFTALFAARVLREGLPPDVDLLKIDVPHNATPQTPWRLTRLARHRYFIPRIQRTGPWEEPAVISGGLEVTRDQVTPDSDVHTLMFDRLVSVTPLSLDMTSRVDLPALEQRWKQG